MYHAVLIPLIVLALICGAGNFFWTLVKYLVMENQNIEPKATSITKIYAKIYRFIMPGATFDENDFSWAIMACGYVTVAGMLLAFLWPVVVFTSPFLVYLLYKDLLYKELAKE